ncbi:MAG TPA: hypothetical protein PLO37_01590 [Candidatus Hydrogenedentes bacterium]|nr:hypothetical protein [Candidatus Hydrogenedentota bacterium]HPG65510.1 hypothetical protein [Candidatus Hydrogenedentota bacterium]
MSENAEFLPWMRAHVPQVRQAWRTDRVKILLFTLLCGLVGFYAGNTIMKTTRSTVQLVVAPMPAQGGSEFLQIAPKMDITSVSLLCKSDEVLQRTLDKVEASGKLTRPIKSIRVLEKALAHRITVANETPMEKTYSDILELSAKSKIPEDAALIVNAWAEEIIAAVDRYEDGMEGPLLEILSRNYEDALATLSIAEKEREDWLIKNNMELVENHRRTVSELVMKHIVELTDTETQLRNEQARLDGLKRAIQNVDSKVSLSWRLPDPEILTAIEAKLGIEISPLVADKDDEPETQETPSEAEVKPDVVSSSDVPTLDDIIAQSQSEPAPDGSAVVTHEMLNSPYWEAYGQLLIGEPLVAGLEARKTYLEQLKASHLAELDELNADLMRMQTEKERMERQYKLVLEVHDMLYPRKKWLEVANDVDYHTLQLLSQGTVWPRTYLWGAAGAGFSALFGFFAAACLSLLGRLVIGPVLKSEP